MTDMLNEIIVPLVGFLTATVLFWSPLPEMLRISKTRLIGNLNVFPLAMIAPNCMAWCFYALFTDNLWLWWSNLPSLLVALWYMSVAVNCTDFKPAQLRLVQLVIIGGTGLCFMGLMNLIAMPAQDLASIRKNVMGAICIVLLVAFYTAPLTALYATIKSRESSLFRLPLAITTTLNGVAWTAFGLYLKDPVLYGTNILGAVNGAVQVACCLLLPNKPAAAAAASDAAVTDSAVTLECGACKPLGLTPCASALTVQFSPSSVSSSVSMADMQPLDETLEPAAAAAVTTTAAAAAYEDVRLSPVRQTSVQ